MDFGLSFFGIWVLAYLLTGIDATRSLTASSFWATLLIGIVEVFFHIYMKRMVLKEEEQVLNSPKKYRGAYATEFSDEYIDRSKIRKEQLLEKVENRKKE